MRSILMREKAIKSIALFGDGSSEDTITWSKFYEYCIGLFQSLDLPLNYLGVIGGPFKSNKILRAKNAQNRLLKSFADGAEFKSLELYSLPDDYQIAVYDYDFYVCRTIHDDVSNILISTSDEYFNQVNCEKLVEELKQFIRFRSGMIFEMWNKESPQLYVAVRDSGQAFNSLKIISEFE